MSLKMISKVNSNLFVEYSDDTVRRFQECYGRDWQDAIIQAMNMELVAKETGGGLPTGEEGEPLQGERVVPQQPAAPTDPLAQLYGTGATRF